ARLNLEGLQAREPIRRVVPRIVASKREPAEKLVAVPQREALREDLGDEAAERITAAPLELDRRRGHEISYFAFEGRNRATGTLLVDGDQRQGSGRADSTRELDGLLDELHVQAGDHESQPRGNEVGILGDGLRFGRDEVLAHLLRYPVAFRILDLRAED